MYIFSLLIAGLPMPEAFARAKSGQRVRSTKSNFVAARYFYGGIAPNISPVMRPILKRANSSVARASSGRGLNLQARQYRPKPVITYFVETEEEARSLSRQSHFRLGGGMQFSLLRDSAASPGAAPLSYAGGAIYGLYETETAWQLHGSLGYGFRNFAVGNDPTGNGSGITGQWWSGTVSVDYEVLRESDFRWSVGWAHQVSYAYRSKVVFASPSTALSWFYRTGPATLGRYSIQEGIDIFVEGQILFAIPSPFEAQGTLGAGILFSLF